LQKDSLLLFPLKTLRSLVECQQLVRGDSVVNESDRKVIKLQSIESEFIKNACQDVHSPFDRDVCHRKHRKLFGLRSLSTIQIYASLRLGKGELALLLFNLIAHRQQRRFKISIIA